MKVLAIIPARGCSKGLLNKNILIGIKILFEKRHSKKLERSKEFGLKARFLFES